MSAQPPEPLLRRQDGAVLTLTLNRPASRNALDRGLVRALIAAFAPLHDDRTVRAVVLAGTGAGFCAGADLKAAFSDGPELPARMEEFNTLIRAVMGAPQPVVAAVQGGAVGYGASLALACDLMLMADDAYLAQKFIKIGLMPDGGATWLLPHRLGLARALELCLLGEDLPAARCAELGLTARVVPPAGLAEAAAALGARLAAGPPLALAATKHALHRALGGTLDQALDHERDQQLKLLVSGDLQEGVQAFFGKRPPAFQGQ